MDKFYLLIVGSRSFTDYSLLEAKVKYYTSKRDNIVIVSGGAKGADSLAKQYAANNNLECIEFYADWKSYGVAAGYIRNEEMHSFIAKHKDRGVVAFWDGSSKGTQHSFELAKKYDNPIRIVRF